MVEHTFNAMQKQMANAAFVRLGARIDAWLHAVVLTLTVTLPLTTKVVLTLLVP